MNVRMSVLSPRLRGDDSTIADILSLTVTLMCPSNVQFPLSQLLFEYYFLFSHYSNGGILGGDYILYCKIRQLIARRAILLYKVYSDSALLALNN